MYPNSQLFRFNSWSTIYVKYVLGWTTMNLKYFQNLFSVSYLKMVCIPFLTAVSANTLTFLQPYNGLNGQLQSMQGATHLRIPHLAIKHSVMGQYCHLSMFQTYPCSCFTVDSASLPSSSSLLSSPSSSSSSASSPHRHRHYHHRRRHH